MFEKNEAQGVFEDAAFGVAGKILLEVEVLYAEHRFFGVTDLPENLAGFLGVKGFERGAPAQIAGPVHGIRIARNLPAAKMLTSRGEEKFLGCGGTELLDPVREAAGHDQFAGMIHAIDLLDIW